MGVDVLNQGVSTETEMDKTVTGLPGDRTSHPVDKGWAWIVNLAVFLMHFFSIGYVRSFGLLFVEVQNMFDSSSAMTSTINGVLSFFFSLSTLVVTNVGLKYASVRTLTLCGCFMCVVGVGASAFASDVKVLIFTVGLLFGIGQGLLYCPCMVILSQYFEKRRSIAIVLATCGVSVGGIVMPILCRYFLDYYGLRGTFLLLSGTLMQQAIFFIMLTPPEHYSFNKGAAKPNHFLVKSQGSIQDDVHTTVPEKEKLMHVEHGFHVPSLTSNSQAQTTGLNDEKQDVHMSLTSCEYTSSYFKENSKHKKDNGVSEFDQQSVTLKTPIRGIARNGRQNSLDAKKDHYIQRSVSHGSEGQSYGLSLSLRDEIFLQSLSSFQSAFAVSSENICAKPHSNVDPDTKTLHLSREFSSETKYDVASTEKELGRSIISSSCPCGRLPIPSLVTEPVFWVLSVYFIGAAVCSVLPTQYIPPLSAEKMLHQHAALYLIVSAVTDVFGRLTAGLILHFRLMRASTVVMAPVLTFGCMCLFTNFYNTFIAMLLYSLACGFFIAFFWVTQTLIVIEVFGLDRLGPALGFYTAFTGISSSVAYPIAGALKDVSGTYNSSFQYFGCMYFLALAMLIVVQFFLKRERFCQRSE